MASFTLVPGTNVGPSMDGNPFNEASLAQAIVNELVGLTTCGMTVTPVYDNVARTLTLTFSGTAS